VLDSLHGQTLPAEQFEVVVVIDGSRDGTQEALEVYEAPFGLRWTWQENRGAAAARNVGLRMAQGDFVVFLDDDLEPEPGFLAALLRAHGDARRLGVLGAVHCLVEPTTTPFVRFWALRFEDFISRLAARSSSLSWTETYSGGLSVPRSELLAVSGYEERFDGYGLEDFELALRLSRAGLTLRLCTEAVAYHRYDKGFATAAREAASNGRSAVIFAALHPGIAADFGPRDPAPPSVARRLVRYGLPRLTLALPFVPALVIRLVGLAERLRSKRLELVYTLGLEYFFLLGQLEASRDGKLTAKKRSVDDR
jgi:glycosyltransferase involved in cell wall biosynthesis